MYFRSDFKNLFRNRFLIILMSAFSFIAVAGPFMSFLKVHNSYEYYSESLGINPFQYWMLIKTSDFGRKIFDTAFWFFPMFIVVIHYFYEQNSSIEKYKIYRGNRRNYYLSKIITVFIYTFFVFALILILNVVVTYILFPHRDIFTEQYNFYVPNEGSFARTIYDISPFLMAVFFCLMNALILALTAVIYLSIYMLVRFKNQYIAMLVPVIAMHGVSFCFGSFGSDHYNIGILLQPMAMSAMTEIFTWKDVFVTYSGWIAASAVFAAAGVIRRNRDLI